MTEDLLTRVRELAVYIIENRAPFGRQQNTSDFPNRPCIWAAYFRTFLVGSRVNQENKGGEQFASRPFSA